DDKSIDAISIATPNHWHALAAIWAMQAGKDVYVEKPVSHNVSEGRRIVETARKYNRICQTGTQIRTSPGVRDAIAFLRQGKLGNQGIHQMHIARWGLGKNELAKSALSFGGRFGYVDDGETANTQVCLFDFGDCELIFEVRGLPTKSLLGASVGNIFYGTEG